MKTYLVPIDFSKASLHAAEFVAALSHQTDVEHIILLNAYYVSVYETTLPTPDLVLLREEEVEQNAADRIKKLESIKRKLYKHVRQGVEISTHLNRSHLVDAVVDNSIDKNVDLVVLGSIGNSSNDDTQIGSHVIDISKASPVPVMVVPPAYDFENISRIALACDFNKVTESVPLEALKLLLDNKKLDLLVANVDNKATHSEKDVERMAEETALHNMLKQYKPKYYYINETDIIKGILQFAADKDVQLVIVLPHKYSFFQALLHSSVSQQLAVSSSVPVLLLK